MILMMCFLYLSSGRSYFRQSNLVVNLVSPMVGSEGIRDLHDSGNLFLYQFAKF